MSSDLIWAVPVLICVTLALVFLEEDAMNKEIEAPDDGAIDRALSREVGDLGKAKSILPDMRPNQGACDDEILVFKTRGDEAIKGGMLTPPEPLSESDTYATFTKHKQSVPSDIQEHLDAIERFVTLRNDPAVNGGPEFHKARTKAGVAVDAIRGALNAPEVPSDIQALQDRLDETLKLHFAGMVPSDCYDIQVAIDALITAYAERDAEQKDQIKRQKAWMKEQDRENAEQKKEIERLELELDDHKNGVGFPAELETEVMKVQSLEQQIQTLREAIQDYVKAFKEPTTDMLSVKGLEDALKSTDGGK